MPTVPHRAGHVRILLNVPRYARIEEMSRIFKSPLKFSRIILYFHFYNDIIFRVFINMCFANIVLQMKWLIYACCMCFVPHKFKFILHPSRWPIARNKNAWERMIDRQKKIFQSDLIHKTNIFFIVTHVKKIGPEFKFACYSCQPDNSLFVSAKKATLLNNEAQCNKLKQTFSNIVVLCLRLQNFFVER